MELLKLTLAFFLTPFVKPSSAVWFDGDLAYKYSRPKPFVRLLFRIFYGRSVSPYESWEGMMRARVLREVANRVCFFFTGHEPFSPALGVEIIETPDGDRPALVQKIVEGERIGRRQGRNFVEGERIAEALIRAGIVPWSLVQPDAHKDMRLVFGRGIVCLDLESCLPPLFVDLECHLMMLRRGRFLPLDFVDFGRLWEVIEMMRAAGCEEVEETEELVRQLETLTDSGGF